MNGHLIKDAHERINGLTRFVLFLSASSEKNSQENKLGKVSGEIRPVELESILICDAS